MNKVLEVRQAGFLCGRTEGGDILCGIGIRRWESVRDGFKSEGGKAVEGGGAPGFQEALVVELCIYKGYVKAPAVKEFCYMEDWGYVALSWVWNTDCVRLTALSYGCGTHPHLSLFHSFSDG